MKRILSHRSFFLGIAALLSILLILFFPTAATDAAADAAETWLRVILPTLLPFAVLSGIFVKSGAAERLSRYAAPISRLFGFSDAFAYVFSMSLLSGYPIGAKITASLRSQDQLSDAEASLMLNAASTSGPAFLVSAVSLNMLGSSEFIPAVLVPHILSAVIVAKLNGCIPHPRRVSAKTTPQSVSLSSIFFDSLTGSVSSMLTVLGAMVLFSALAAVFSAIFAHLCPHWLAALMTGFLEFSSGCILASSLDPSVSLPLIAFISGFGSLSVLLQTSAVASSCGIRMKGFLISKLLQGALAALIASFFARSLPALLISTFAASLFGLLFFARYLARSTFFTRKKAIRCR